MDFLKILMEPAIIIITTFFLVFMLHVIRTYSRVEKNLKSTYETLQTFSKKEISYRFAELNEFMSTNPFTAVTWEDFKKALIFPEKLYTVAQTQKMGGEYTPEIYLTIDASYFFNEETLVNSNINHKFIQSMSTLLTGLGPLFTFMKMAIAFTEVDFTSTEMGASLNGLIHNIQVAALCSVFAVGYSLIFIFFEKRGIKI